MENFDLILTLVVLAGVVFLLVTNLVRNDIVALGIILVMMGAKILTIPEALSGFSSHVVLIMACMFIIGETIVHTGIAQRFGEAIIRYGGVNETKLLAMIMAAACSIGAFMSSTATAAIFIPITLSVAEKAKINPKRLLLPLAVASLISGMMTLVATTPNIIVNNALRELNQTPLTFFGFTPFGVLVLILAVLFMIFFGQNMLAPKIAPVEEKRQRTINDLMAGYGIAQNEYLMRVPKGSRLVDRNVVRMQIGAQYHVNLLAMKGVRDGKRTILAAHPEVVFHEDDLLLFIAAPENAARFAEDFNLESLEHLPMRSHRRQFFQVVGVAEVMLTPDSNLIGKTLKEIGFQSQYHCLVLGVRRKDSTLTDHIGEIPLKFGDVLLICGAWEEILRLGQNRDQYLLLTIPHDYREVVPGRNREKMALSILAVMVGLMAFEILPPVTAILGATLGLILTRCVKISNIYTVIDWPTLVLIAGILPLVLALQKTGIITLVSAGFLELFGEAPPLLVLAGLFILTSMLGIFMSNAAVAVLIAPLAIGVGIKLNISPQACAMTVAIACSAVFISPLGSPVNMIVRAPGGYSFSDYLKTGLPLLFLSLVATLFLLWFFYL